eukprot:1739811-Amphidinium_carterae.2
MHLAHRLNECSKQAHGTLLTNDAWGIHWPSPTSLELVQCNIVMVVGLACQKQTISNRHKQYKHEVS